MASKSLFQSLPCNSCYRGVLQASQGTFFPACLAMYKTFSVQFLQSSLFLIYLCIKKKVLQTLNTMRVLSSNYTLSKHITLVPVQSHPVDNIRPIYICMHVQLHIRKLYK
jgi:hypothetical protein